MHVRLCRVYVRRPVHSIIIQEPSSFLADFSFAIVVVNLLFIIDLLIDLFTDIGARRTVFNNFICMFRSISIYNALHDVSGEFEDRCEFLGLQW